MKYFKRMKIFLTFITFFFFPIGNVFADEINLKSDMDHGLNLGVWGGGDPLWKKKLNTSIGDRITIEDYYFWSYDDTQWMSGGKLHLINDDSLGTSTRVVCSVDSKTGDDIVSIGKRMSVKVDGIIAKYNDSGGLRIDPCNITY